MYFLFSGEGPTDMGRCSAHQSRCRAGNGYQPGPMAKIVCRLVQDKHQYDPLTRGGVEYVSEKELCQAAKRIKGFGLPGMKRGKETRFFFKNARAMARLAKQEQCKQDDNVVAVLFRDADGTASAGRGDWQDKWQSMMDGFEVEEFDRGVPMIPKPKSEAWLLCASKYNYQSCAKLKDRSGNDRSPNSLKNELAEHLDGQTDREPL